MWAADISHVNYLQFPNVDRLGLQEKLSRRQARHAGRQGFQGVPFLPNKGLPRGVSPRPGWQQLFLGGPLSSSPGQKQGRGISTDAP